MMYEWEKDMDLPGGINHSDDDRDLQEEEYNRNYCDICGYSPCRSDNGHAEEFDPRPNGELQEQINYLEYRYEYGDGE